MALSWLIMIVLFLLPNKLHSQSSDTTVFNFSSFAGNEADLIYQGDAYIPQPLDRPPGVEEGQTFVRLTEAFYYAGIIPSMPFPNSVGRVLYSPPIRLWDAARRRQANFQTVIRGYIGNFFTNFTPPPVKFTLGDGMSFFIAPVNTSIPPNSKSGHMGLYDASGTSPTPLFAVELDVNVNTWDPDFLHVGINVNNRTSVSVASWQNEVGGGNDRVLEARITYAARERLITVLVNCTNDHNPARPINARLDYTYDLKTLLPEWVQIGISASTLEWDEEDYDEEEVTEWVSALHDVRGWSFISFMENYDVVQDT